MQRAVTQPKARPPARRRWRQFSLRSLLLLPLIAAALLLARDYYLRPFRAQRKALAFFEEQGAAFETTPAGTKWSRRLLGVPDLQHVVRVDCCDSRWSDESQRHVLRLPELESLVVAGPGFRDRHLAQLASLQKLRLLIVDTTAVTDRGLAELRKARPNLHVHESQRLAIAKLTKSRNNLRFKTQTNHGLPGPLAAAHTQVADGLFCAIRADLTDADMFYVGALADLERLYLYVGNLSDDGFRHVARMKSLKILYFMNRTTPKTGPGGTRLTGRGLAWLGALPKLEALHLERTPLGDDDLAALGEFKQLKALDLSDTELTDAGLEPLKALQQLQELDLERTAVTEAGVAELRIALPQCEIDY